MCAIAIPEAKFINDAKRSPIDISAVPPQRYKLVRKYTHKHTHSVFFVTLPLYFYVVLSDLISGTLCVCVCRSASTAASV